MKFKNLSFSINGKPILQSTFGTIASATCILGPSGSGKTSLLNVLSGRVAAKRGVMLEGTVTVGGIAIDPVANKRNVAYVMQDDALPPTATVKECILFSVNLRCDQSYSQAERKSMVDDIITKLRLENCRDTFIGSATLKGISGGERKRTSIAIELVSRPRIVFLDEPTSGLDSFSAYSISVVLDEMAENGTTVLATMHQPSSQVFQLFERAIVLSDTGEIIYTGLVSDMAEYYANRGYPCEPFTNLADHALFTIMRNSEACLRASGMFMKLVTKKGRSVIKMGRPVEKDNFEVVTASSIDADNVDESVLDEISLSSSDGEEKHSGDAGKVTEIIFEEAISVEEATKDDAVYLPYRSSQYQQLKWLLWRESKALLRDKSALLGRFGITIFLNLLFGLIFLNAGRQDDNISLNLRNHYGALTLVTTNTLFGSAQPVILQFPIDRPVFLREYSTGTYKLFPYIANKIVFEIALLFFQTLLQYLIVYFMIGFRGNFGNMILVNWLLGLSSNSVAALLGSSVTNIKTASEFLPLIFVPQLLFSGFFVSISAIPAFLRWARYLCSLYYALALLSLIEFNPETCDEGQQAQEGCANLLEANDIQSDLVWLYTLVLCLMFVVYRLTAAYILRKRAKTVY